MRRSGAWVGVAAIFGCVVFEEPLPGGSSTDATGEAGSSGDAPTTSAAGPTEDAGGTTSGPATTMMATTEAGSEGSEEGPTSGGEATTGEPMAPPIVTEVFAFVDHDVGDVDGDGRVDLVTSATGQPPRLTVYAGAGDGTFAGAAAVETEVFAFAGFVVADVTGDGRADALVEGTGQPPRVTVYAGQGDATFAELATLEVFAFTHMHAIDVDGDGLAELLTGKGEGTPPQIHVWSGTPAGVVGPPLASHEVWQFAAMRGGDVDGDGRVDVVGATAGSFPRRALYRGDGAGGLAEAEFADIFDFTRIDVGDVDGDGRADMVTDVPTNAWRFQIYRGTDDTPTVLDGFNFSAFELGDVDGDGGADIVAVPTGAPPRVEVYLAPLGP